VRFRRVSRTRYADAPESLVPMSPFASAITAGASATLVLDTVGSIASKRIGFSYPKLAPLSFAIYTVVGGLAARDGSISDAVLAATIVGFIEATIGWRISWLIGPGRWKEVEPSPSRLAATILRVMLLAAVCGAVGGFVVSLSAGTA
jgi:hypothetical protein